MCRRNIRESLTARIFLLTLLLLLGAGGLTFGLIAWATPITYVSVVGDRLQVQVNELTDRLALTKLADAGPILMYLSGRAERRYPWRAPTGRVWTRVPSMCPSPRPCRSLIRCPPIPMAPMAARHRGNGPGTM